MIEKLTDVERCLLIEGDPDSCDKALRIIDRLTKALELSKIADCSVDRTRALESRIKELESQNECAGLLLMEELKMRRELESEVTKLKDRIDTALPLAIELGEACGHWAVAEILRGK